jgi:hypothetical protein
VSTVRGQIRWTSTSLNRRVLPTRYHRSPVVFLLLTGGPLSLGEPTQLSLVATIRKWRRVRGPRPFRGGVFRWSA